MLRKIAAGTLITFSSILSGLSIAVIVLTWMYKQPLTQLSTIRLQALDTQLGQVHMALQSAEAELERTRRTVEAAEKILVTLKADLVQAKTLFGDVNGALNKELLPGLKASRKNIDQAKSGLIELQVTLAKINAQPSSNLKLSGDKLLTDLIASTGSLDAQITQVEDLVKKASTFLGDASYLMQADLTETKQNLQNFLAVVRTYDQELGARRTQLATLIKSLPGWIESTAIGLTIFLLWFSLSQLSLSLHGLTLWRGKTQHSPAA